MTALVAAAPEPPPLTWRGHAGRIGFALLPAIIGGSSAVVFPRIAGVDVTGIPFLIDLGVGVLASTALYWHREHRVLVATGIALAQLISPTSQLALLVALASVATRWRWRPIVGVYALGLAAQAAYGLWQSRLIATQGDRVTVTNQGLVVARVDVLIVSAVVMALAVVVGLVAGRRRALVGGLRQRAEAAEAEQAARVAAARAAERHRIAREMHDVLAHRISLLSLHAGVLGYRDDLSREQVKAEAELIQRTSTEALGELRGILGLLRATEVPLGEAAASVEAPQPSLHDLADLVEQARSAGTPVQLDLELPVGASVPPAVGRHLYRIAQEALTNARKHAPRAAVRVTVQGQPGGQVVLWVRNGAPPTDRMPIAPVPGSGLGLVGAAERAAIVGGTLEHGPFAGGGYSVQARLPWEEARGS